MIRRFANATQVGPFTFRTWWRGPTLALEYHWTDRHFSLTVIIRRREVALSCRAPRTARFHGKARRWYHPSDAQHT